MDKRLDLELNTAMYGFYSYATESGFKLTHDCSDLAKLLEKNVEEIQNRELAELVFPLCSDDVISELKEQLEHGKDVEVLISFAKKDGTCISVLSRGKVEEDRFGNEYVRNVFVVAEKTRKTLDELKYGVELYRKKLFQTENKINLLQTCAEQDSLTKILNAGTTRRLAEEYVSAPQSNCAMLVVDVDDFKRINDRYGHMVGDSVMICAADAIKKLFRANDIVGRIGGDEFLVLMKDISDVNIVSLRCSQILEAFRAMRFDVMKNEELSCSVGAAVFGVSKISYDEMFSCADKAMYRAKNLGGNQYVVIECK
jgi:diguanylate cyclase (GGDEF)-like protein